MSDPTVPYRNMDALGDSIIGLRRAIDQPGKLTDAEREAIEATFLYFWNYCVNPHLIELPNGTVLHIPESGQPDEHGRPKFCAGCGHGAYIKGEDLCGNCLPMEWHDRQKEADDE